MPAIANQNHLTINVKSGYFTIELQGLGGWKQFSTSVNGQSSAGGLTNVTMEKQRTTAILQVEGLEERWIFDKIPERNGVVFTRLIHNPGVHVQSLSKIQDGRLDTQGRLEWEGLQEYSVRYIHSANMRTEVFPKSRPEYPYVRPVPYIPQRLGHGEGNHIPALLITDAAYSVGFLQADLNQTRFERIWDLGLKDLERHADPLLGCYQASQQPSLSQPLFLKPGETCEVSRVWYQIQTETPPQYSLIDTWELLNREHRFAGPRSPMLKTAVFCTWNYGTLANIDEQLLDRRSKAVAERIPKCRFFLIDDGFQQDRGKRNGPLDTYYPVPADCYDRNKFPSGMKAMAEVIKGHGLQPAIWLSPQVYLDSPLARAHPEWLLCDAHGDPALLGKATYLDLSVEEAKTFFVEVLDALFVEWGYQGVKFDFLTQWFSLEKARYRNGGTGPEWRDWVYGEIRKRIGEDGLFMTCIAMSMGNPFPGLYADCYRCGCDIHDGTWEEQLRNVRATLPQILLEGRKTFLLNMDSAGFGNVPAHEQMLRLTWVFITQGIFELGGPVEDMPESQIQLWTKMLAHTDRGHRVTCLDEAAFMNEGLPRVLMVAYPKDSLTFKRGVQKHIALFNWDNPPRHVGCTLEEAGISDSDTVTDFWTEERLKVNGKDLVGRLLGHSARLLTVRS